MLPRNLVLVRHGRSEGNAASKRSEQGDHSDYANPAFASRLGSRWRLTKKGREQADAAGDWIRRNFPEAFDRFSCSTYLRAMETACRLKLPKAKWYPSRYVRERNWGDLAHLSKEEQLKRFADSLRAKEQDALEWYPPNGESMEDLCLRLEKPLGTLERKCPDGNDIEVCHGEVMWGYRLILERMTAKEFLRLDLSEHPHDRIHNCQIHWYTRIDPDTGAEAKSYKWLKRVCPWDESLSPGTWDPIVTRGFSNEELAALVEETPQLIDD